MRYFSSPGSLRRPMDSDGDDPKGPGFPIRISTDQSSFAAPHGFSQRTTSFIASRCQGIHQTPLRRLIDPTSNGQRPCAIRLSTACTGRGPERRTSSAFCYPVSTTERSLGPVTLLQHDECLGTSSGPGSPGHHAIHHVQQPPRIPAACPCRPEPVEAISVSAIEPGAHAHPRNRSGGPGKT